MELQSNHSLIKYMKSNSITRKTLSSSDAATLLGT
jgi:hypothetical protein